MSVRRLALLAVIVLIGLYGVHCDGRYVPRDPLVTIDVTKMGLVWPILLNCDCASDTLIVYDGALSNAVSLSTGAIGPTKHDLPSDSCIRFAEVTPSGPQAKFSGLRIPVVAVAGFGVFAGDPHLEIKWLYTGRVRIVFEKSGQRRVLASRTVINSEEVDLQPYGCFVDSCGTYTAFAADSRRGVTLWIFRE